MRYSKRCPGSDTINCLPQILQSLQSKDTEFLRERGHLELVHRLNAERKGIALRFLTLLQEEYRTFWEASRMLAATAPDVVAVEEWERLPLSTIFTWNCFLLQLKLRAGFAPRVNFTRLSDMASQIPIAWSRRPRKSARAFDRLLNFPRP